jgi:hypothetical protein
VSWADAPVAGRRPCRWSSPIAGTSRMARPRSAVAVWPSAPGLTPLTGFSRSGRSSSLGWLALACEALVRPWPSLRLTAECGHPVDDRCTIMPALVGQHQVHRPSDAPQGVRRSLHVRERRRASAFHALAGRPVRPNVSEAITNRPFGVAWVTPDPLASSIWTKGRCRRGAR